MKQISILTINEITNHEEDDKKVTFNLTIGGAIMTGYYILSKEHLHIINGNYGSINEYILTEIKNFI